MAAFELGGVHAVFHFCFFNDLCDRAIRADRAR
jgi:hypothetical protein